MSDIDFSKGGYGGDVIEELFKPYTIPRIEYWWHFREVLRPCQQKGLTYWRKADSSNLADSDWEELIGLSMTNYAVYTGLAEAISYFEQMQWELHRTTHPGWRIFEVRRNWKAMYSSLYSSFTALSNVICLVVGNRPLFKGTTANRNYDPGDAEKAVAAIPLMHSAVTRCMNRLEIRNQLDHYWVIWHDINQGSFLIDRNFTKKAHLVIDPASQADVSLDALEKAKDDLFGCCDDFNALYKAMATENSYLDTFFSSKGRFVDYSDYGPPHNRKRPLP